MATIICQITKLALLIGAYFQFYRKLHLKVMASMSASPSSWKVVKNYPKCVLSYLMSDLVSHHPHSIPFQTCNQSPRSYISSQLNCYLPTTVPPRKFEWGNNKVCSIGQIFRWENMHYLVIAFLSNMLGSCRSQTSSPISTNGRHTS